MLFRFLGRRGTPNFDSLDVGSLAMVEHDQDSIAQDSKTHELTTPASSPWQIDLKYLLLWCYGAAIVLAAVIFTLRFLYDSGVTETIMMALLGICLLLVVVGYIGVCVSLLFSVAIMATPDQKPDTKKTNMRHAMRMLCMSITIGILPTLFLFICVLIFQTVIR